MTHKPDRNRKKNIYSRQHKGLTAVLKCMLASNLPYLSFARLQSMQAEDSRQNNLLYDLPTTFNIGER